MQFAIPNNLDDALSLSEYFSSVGKAGFGHVALRSNPAHCDYNEHIGRLQLLSYGQSDGLVFDSLHIPSTQDFDITSTNSESRMGAVCNVANVMHAARVLGVRTVVLSISHSLPSRFGGDTRSVLHALEGLVETAEIMRLNLALRNLIDSKSLETLRDALSEYRSPNFGLCYDTALDLLADHEPYRILDEFGDRLKAAVFADTDGKSLQDIEPFQGIVDWHHVMAVIAAIGYQAPVTLGYHGNPNLPCAERLRSMRMIADRINQLDLT